MFLPEGCFLSVHLHDTFGLKIILPCHKKKLYGKRRQDKVREKNKGVLKKNCIKKTYFSSLLKCTYCHGDIIVQSCYTFFWKFFANALSVWMKTREDDFPVSMQDGRGEAV